MENNQGSTLINIAQQEFAEKVKTYRSSKGMTQAELADAVNRHGLNFRQGTIAKIENGSRPTSIGEMKALSVVFGVSPSALVGTDSVPSRVALVLSQREKIESEIDACNDHSHAMYRAAVDLERRMLEFHRAIREHDETINAVRANHEEALFEELSVTVGLAADVIEEIEEIEQMDKHDPMLNAWRKQEREAEEWAEDYVIQQRIDEMRGK